MTFADYLRGIIIAILLLGISACSSANTEPTAEPTQANPTSLPEPPETYAALSNPLGDEADILSQGEDLYRTNCVACHGESGRGDGVAATSLNPQPADFTDSAHNAAMSDAYIFWRISEGGLNAPFQSAMPAWKSVFSEEQIWQITSYIRSLAGK